MEGGKLFFEVRGTFNSVTTWSHDKPLPEDHPTQRALDWVQIAQAVSENPSALCLPKAHPT